MRDLSPQAVRATLTRYPFQCFPLETADGQRGLVTRRELENALARGTRPAVERAVFCRPAEILEDIQMRLLDSPTGMMLVTDDEGGPVVGLFTLHDLLRAQAAVSE